MLNVQGTITAPYYVRFIYIFYTLINFVRFYNALFVWTVDMLKTYSTLIKNLHFDKPNTQTLCIKTEMLTHFIHR
jgi:hypothetical protein